MRILYLMAPALMTMPLAMGEPPSKPAASEPSAPASTKPVDEPAAPRTPPAGLLTPIPETGGLPPIYSKLYDLTADEIRHRAVVRDYARQIRMIRHKHFGQIKVEKIRAQGLDLLCEFTDPAAFGPMVEELQREQDDVKLAMLDHFATQGDEGQAALAWEAIYDSDPAIRNEALKRMTAPVTEPVRYILNSALRSRKHEVANAAAMVAGSLNVIQAIPLLIFAQAVGESNAAEEGDLAWIAIQTQRAYVQSLTPVTGDNTGAFQPVVGIVSEGVVMRVVDAVVISYRTAVHSALVNLTSSDWGQPTEPMGYNIQAWWDWYNTQYIPFKRDQAEAARLRAGGSESEEEL